MGHFGWRPHLEWARVLSIKNMLKDQSIIPNTMTAGTRQWVDRYDYPVYKLDYQATLTATYGELIVTHWVWRPNRSEKYQVSYTIELDTTPLHLGGRRWWFRCPLTGRRALKLYLFPKIEKFCHRTAVHPLPTYASQRLPKLEQVVAQRWAVREKLKDVGDLFDPVTKPLWMRWRTFNRYADRDKALEAKELRLACRRFGSVMDG